MAVMVNHSAAWAFLLTLERITMLVLAAKTRMAESSQLVYSTYQNYTPVAMQLDPTIDWSLEKC